MDITHHKLTNNWEPYNIATLAEEQAAVHLLQTTHQTPFDQYNMNNYPPDLLQNHYQLSPIPSSTSTSQQVSAPNLLGLDQTQDLKLEAGFDDEEGEQEEELGAMKEMMFKIAAMQPVDIDPATIRKPKRRNVRISEDPQSVAARHRRERISEKIRILQRLVPGGTKMDTASMLDEAIRYVKFLKRQIRLLQSNQHQLPPLPANEWVAAASNTTTATPIFGGNYCNNDGGSGQDDDIDPMCFNKDKFDL